MVCDVGPRPRCAERTRRALIEAAGDLFASHGFDAVGLRDIARAAAVDAALIPRYFGSKAGLCEAVLASGAWDALCAGDPATFGCRIVDRPLGADSGPEARAFALLFRAILSEAGSRDVRAAAEAAVLRSLEAALGGPDAGARAQAAWTLIMGLLARRAMGLEPGAREVLARTTAHWLQTLMTPEAGSIQTPASVRGTAQQPAALSH